MTGLPVPAALTSDIALDHERLERIRHGALLVEDWPAVFQIEGKGARDLLQGLLTNDLVAPGDDSLVYGAMLTPKGMILVDAWVIQHGGVLWLIAERAARELLQGHFTRQLPPRLGKATDRTDAWGVSWLLGSAAILLLQKAGEAAGDPGRVTELRGVPGVIAGRPPSGAPAPFAALLLGEGSALAALRPSLARAGVGPGTESDRETARILAGWPRLGVEIEEKTLPQEVRYDEIGGVSYTKGCYTGQETVARVHFRGHPNRELRGLVWPGGMSAVPQDRSVIDGGGKSIGTVRSTLLLPDRVLALAVLRREAQPGARVTLGGIDAEVVPLPFEPALLER